MRERSGRWAVLIEILRVEMRAEIPSSSVVAIDSTPAAGIRPMTGTPRKPLDGALVILVFFADHDHAAHLERLRCAARSPSARCD